MAMRMGRLLSDHLIGDDAVRGCTGPPCRTSSEDRRGWIAPEDDELGLPFRVVKVHRTGRLYVR